MDTQYNKTLYEIPSIKKNITCKTSWDQRAKGFNESQKNDGMNTSIKLTEMLLNKQLLKGYDILDIGGGTGRYAIPFSKHANEIILTDVSSQMLYYAKNNAENAGCYNLKYSIGDWGTTDLKELNWKTTLILFSPQCARLLGLKKELKK